MTAVLHTWGSNLKYHVHAHCLVTFGGLDGESQPGWRWPRRKHKLAPFRKLSGVFRTVFLAGLKRLMDKGAVVYHRTFEELKVELTKKRWVVHHGRPTAETKVIEEYLGRYICRIGISNKRLHYDKQGKNVRIEYNDYRNQKNGEAAPKAYLNLHPLVAMHQILQHQLPAYFQRVRYYGLHASASYHKYQDQLPDQVTRNGYTVRTIIQILKALLAQEPYQCAYCGATDFVVDVLTPDRQYLIREVLKKTASGLRPGRSPPGVANTTGKMH
jgi:hypothetical protein